jgi:hypothetical protein
MLTTYDNQSYVVGTHPVRLLSGACFDGWTPSTFLMSIGKLLPTQLKTGYPAGLKTTGLVM